MRYADVIVDISHEKLDRTFSYRIPQEMQKTIIPGSVVKVPFGAGSRIIKGYVVGFSDHCDVPEDKMKSIAEIVTDEETADSRLVQLAAWMSRNYGSTLIRSLKTVIPIRQKIAGKVSEIVSVTDPEAAKEAVERFEKKHYKAKARTMSILLSEGTMKLGDLEREAKVPLSVVRGLREEGLLTIDISETYRRVVMESKTLPPDVLTNDQQRVVRDIRREWSEKNRTVLLNGVTGSGKTVVYMELIADILAEGKDSIVLIPEISLTWQTVLRFYARFGDKVSFLHSRLSRGERYDQMKAARKGDVRIMVGPRSALFTPFEHLGLIIIDEEHEETYHSEQVPRYHARETAEERARLEGAHLVLGSATPSLISAWRVNRGIYAGVRLHARYGESVLPETEIVDMRAEIESGNRSILSRRLEEEIRARLAKKEQVMLFLNRRGYSGCVTCRSCGTVIKCPHCDVSLTRHANHTLVCHYCGYEIPELTECPECHSRYIGGLTIGTEQVEEYVSTLFPQAKILRMDADTTKGKGGHRKILEEFGAGNADILIGTQMIVKGHDFPNVTLVGILMADLSLNESDYRASERTYGLITQAVGRAGRGAKRGLALIQTYQPEHFAITSGAIQNFDMFYKEEMLFRTLMSYPPAGHMEAILVSGENEAVLLKAMDYLKQYIGRIDPKGRLHAIGPAPQAVGKVRDQYRQVIYLRSDNKENLILAKDMLEKYISLNSGFNSLTIQFDFDS